MRNMFSKRSGATTKSTLIAIFLSVIAIAPCLYLVYNKSTFRSNEVQVDRNGPVPLTEEEFEKFKQQILNSQIKEDIDFHHQKIDDELKVGGQYSVVACKVIDGYRFLVQTESEQWIEIHLPVAAKEEAANPVIERLKLTQSNPSIKMLRMVKGYWIADLQIQIEGKQESLISFLKTNNLLLN